MLLLSLASAVVKSAQVPPSAEASHSYFKLEEKPSGSSLFFVVVMVVPTAGLPLIEKLAIPRLESASVISAVQLVTKEPEFATKQRLRLPEGFQEQFAPATLDKPRAAYNALNDWLPEATAKYSDIKSGCCYETSFQSRIEQVGNYKQMTNNFKHAYPDTCSMPFKELLMTFYKPQTLNSSL